MAASRGRVLDTVRVGRGIERGDVVGDRAGEQPVVLQDAADLRAIMLHPDRRDGHAVQQHGAAAGRQQSGEDLQQGRLAGAGRTDNRHALAGGNVEVEVRDDLRLVVAVAEADRRARSKPPGGAGPTRPEPR